MNKNTYVLSLTANFFFVFIVAALSYMILNPHTHQQTLRNTYTDGCISGAELIAMIIVNSPIPKKLHAELKNDCRIMSNQYEP